MVVTPSTKVKAGPDWRPPSWENIHQHRWEKVDDVYEALSIATLKTKYLKQPIGEENESYGVRVDLASMSQDLKEAVQANAGLMSEFEIEEETPELLKESFTNVDKQGNSLSQFIVQAAASLFKNECVLLGCHIDTRKPGDLTERYPYFSCIDVPKRVFAPYVEMIDGASVLSRISIRSDEQVECDDGFALETRETYWVYRLRYGSLNADQSLDLTEENPGRKLKRFATVQKYQREEGSKNGANSELVPVSEEKVLTTAKSAQDPLTRLPFVWVGIDPNSKIGEPGMPPFFAMAEKLIRVFNLESELDAIQRKVNIPIPTQEHQGAVPEEPENVMLGADHVWHHAFGTHVGFAEPTGSAIAISEQRIQALKLEIASEQERFLGSNPQTATASLLDAGQNQMSLQTIAHSIESATEELFKLWALMGDRTYTDGDDAGGISISFKFLKPPINYQDVLTLAPMFELGVFKDMYEVRAKAKEIGYLTDHIIEEADEMRLRDGAEPARLNLEKATRNGQPVILGS
jgi:hypothetical protein